MTTFRSHLIIGSGRLARHLKAYFELEALPFDSWKRADGLPALEEKSAVASHMLFAVSDSSIEPLYRECDFLWGKTCVHFSGAMSTRLMPSAHPLMTFANDLYDLETYRRIPFVLEEDRGGLPDLLPGLMNPSYSIPSERKTLYHALCVLSGNFTVLLWEKAFHEFARLGLPKEVLLPYLEQTARNLSHSEENASVLTGPLARGDKKTIARHLDVLAEDPFREVYDAFVSAHSQTTGAAT